MSKYDQLWQYIGTLPPETLNLTFDQIHRLTGFPLDHSFLTYKKELISFGWQVKKISIKQQVVTFEPLEARNK